MSIHPRGVCRRVGYSGVSTASVGLAGPRSSLRTGRALSGRITHQRWIQSDLAWISAFKRPSLQLEQIRTLITSGEKKRCGWRVSNGVSVRFSSHHGHHRVSAEEVRLVLDHSAERWTQEQWASYFRVYLDTLRHWRAKGFIPRKYSAPTEERWEKLEAVAFQNLCRGIRLLDPAVAIIPSIVILGIE